MCFDINNLDIKKLNFRKVKNAIHLSLSGDKYQFWRTIKLSIILIF